MAELIVTKEAIRGFGPYEIVKVYQNGYYRKWKKKGVPTTGMFVIRLPFIQAREIKRLFLNWIKWPGGGSKRLFRLKKSVNPNDRPCETWWSFSINKWLEPK